MRAIVPATALCLLTALTVLPQDEAALREDRPAWLAFLVSRDQQDYQRGRRMAVQQQVETEKALLWVLRRPVERNEPFYGSSARNRAIWLLGQYRIKTAPKYLVDWLEPKEGQGTWMTESRRFPLAGDAMIKIGLPSVPVLTDKVKAEGDRRYFMYGGMMCVDLIVEIKGHEETIIHFQRELAKETDEAKKANLQAALAYLQKQE